MTSQLDAACREAKDDLLDQSFFTVKTETFQKFQALLDKREKSRKEVL